jgi:hypothetical protein
MKTVNAEIINCGLFYCGHNDECFIHLITDQGIIDFSVDRLYKFVEIFPDIEWDSGNYIYKLKGRYIRLVYDDSYHVIGIKHIVKDCCFIIKE